MRALNVPRGPTANARRTKLRVSEFSNFRTRRITSINIGIGAENSAVRYRTGSQIHGSLFGGCFLVERNSDGSLKNEVRCVPCADGLRPSNDRSACVPCRYHPVLASATPGGGPGGGSGGGGKCDCDLSAGGICLPANLEIPPDRYTPSARDEVVLFPELGEVRSAFFKEHVKVGAYMCNVSGRTASETSEI